MKAGETNHLWVNNIANMGGPKVVTEKHPKTGQNSPIWPQTGPPRKYRDLARKQAQNRPKTGPKRGQNRVFRGSPGMVQKGGYDELLAVQRWLWRKHLKQAKHGFYGRV